MLIVSILLCHGLALAAPDTSDRLEINDVVGPPTVKVIRAGRAAKEENVRKGEILFVGDQVEVAPRQIVGLAAYDRSLWKLAPGTRFKVEARKPDRQNFSYWSFRVITGAMWGKVTKIENGKDGFRLKVHTPSAAMGVRGTEYLMNGSGVDVLEGKVWWGKSAGFEPGSYREVTAGQHAEISAGGEIRVTPSQGDKGKLVKDYGLVVEDDQAQPTAPHSAQQCAELGLGWRSGAHGGECFRNADSHEERR